jgi:hypothetical protein
VTNADEEIRTDAGSDASRPPTSGRRRQWLGLAVLALPTLLAEPAAEPAG